MTRRRVHCARLCGEMVYTRGRVLHGVRVSMVAHLQHAQSNFILSRRETIEWKMELDASWCTSNGHVNAVHEINTRQQAAGARRQARRRSVGTTVSRGLAHSARPHPRAP